MIDASSLAMMVMQGIRAKKMHSAIETYTHRQRERIGVVTYNRENITNLINIDSRVLVIVSNS